MKSEARTEESKKRHNKGGSAKQTKGLTRGCWGWLKKEIAQKEIMRWEMEEEAQREDRWTLAHGA